MKDYVTFKTPRRFNKAKWHDSCKFQFNKTTLQRAEKRKSHIEDNTDVSKKFARQSVDEAPPSNKTCFFCRMPPVGESLRNASTFQADVRVRQYAVILSFPFCETKC